MAAAPPAGQSNFNEHPQPRTFAPSKEDVLQNLQYFFSTSPVLLSISPSITVDLRSVLAFTSTVILLQPPRLSDVSWVHFEATASTAASVISWQLSRLSVVRDEHVAIVHGTCWVVCEGGRVSCWLGRAQQRRSRKTRLAVQIVVREVEVPQLAQLPDGARQRTLEAAARTRKLRQVCASAEGVWEAAFQAVLREREGHEPLSERLEPLAVERAEESVPTQVELCFQRR